ncbi:hypothetical protein LSCM1_08199 [Leishmania martiniquensis]|uniref:Aspartic peptidase DDI1-type domain-containing protein n=1 Tax=Leishmania martiniquensis TaxID=1580590 RepID=A0A836HKX8_9TRYP|nr:hypothetical protein LSCM1_08199 [Leishmania martiniquensis]
MVQLTIVNAKRVTLCRVTVSNDATVQQLLLQLAAVRPELREVSALRNDARGVTHCLGQASANTRRRAASAAQTLVEAGLVGQDATTETLVVLMPASAVPPSVGALKGRILELFGRSPAPPAAAAAPSSSTTAAAGQASALPAIPEAMDERQLALQRRLLTQIRQQQIDENLANALEYTPEAFAKVSMLYVPCTVNQVPLSAFVDSGAQHSIMNKSTAERCGLMRLVDVRMRGVAVGVGQQVICGRIHMVPVNLAGMFIPFAFSVIEDQAMSLIIGLDQLRRHQMLIDLRRNCLTIGNVDVAFLPERDLPASASLRLDAAEDTPAEENLSVRVPRHRDPAAAAAAAPLSDSERQARIDGFMTVSGITDRRQAVALLEAASWDVNVAAALFFDT